jgi:O-acetyl-ADP-ribose deacetylase (regulator of RNase III)
VVPLVERLAATLHNLEGQIMIKYVKGDLFESGLRNLAQGCNTRGVMGAGISRTFRERYPVMYHVYRALCQAHEFKLGDSMPWLDVDTNTVIFNLATQNLGENANPDAIDLAIHNMVNQAKMIHVTEIGMPWIGCGIGGLKFGELQEILVDFHSSAVDLIVHEYNA